MKVIKVLTLLALIGVLGVAQALAIDTIDVPVTASVPNESLDMTVDIKELIGVQDPGISGTIVSTMSFGSLIHKFPSNGSEAGAWFSEKWYAVFMYTSSFGHPYQITSTCAGLTSGGNSLPVGSFVLKPDYNSLDEWVWVGGSAAQGGMPIDAVLGTEGPAVGTNLLIYRSELAASNRIIRAYYSLPNPTATPPSGYNPIPLSQASGDYSGTVTIKIAAY